MKNLTREDIERYEISYVDLVKIAHDHLDADGNCPDYIRGECNECGVCELWVED